MGGPLSSLTSEIPSTSAISDQAAGEKTREWDLFLRGCRGAILDTLNAVSHLKET